MTYTKTEILEKCEKAFKNVSTFYQSDVVNYRGVTTDTGELYSELVKKNTYTVTVSGYGTDDTTLASASLNVPYEETKVDNK